MTTLYGGPIPPDFTDGEQLTAAGFNAVKNYWVVDGELPEDAEDGDVVFSIGEVAVGGSSWGDFTTSGDEQASGTYTDTAGRDWKWAEWNVAADYLVNLTGGVYWVLTTSAGSNGTSTAMGQPGTVVEGYWEFSAGDTPITVGESFPKGPNAGQGGGGGPSSIGDYGNQGWTSWGDPNIGRGSTLGYGGGDVAIRYLGYSSTITGEAKGYAPSVLSAAPLRDRPGRSGYDASSLASDGCVIIATVTNEPSDWNPPGQIPGVGGWATITDVSGTYDKYTYNDSGVDWVSYEFTDDGTLETSGGLVDVLLCGSGGAGSSTWSGDAGYLITGLHNLDVNNEIKVGKGHTYNQPVTKSQLGSLFAGGGVSQSANGGGSAGSSQETILWTGTVSKIRDGNPVEYCQGVSEPLTPPGAQTPGSGSTGAASQDGVCIVRVPASNAQGVSETRHGWVNFATVENGVVTSVNKTPDNIPYTTAVDEVPCGPEVSEGYFYDGSEFIAPEPDYSEQIKELEEKLKNLRSAK